MLVVKMADRMSVKMADLMVVGMVVLMVARKAAQWAVTKVVYSVVS